ncbi:hypothetical protein [Kingella potus]|uniref:hypothetical protein n=1 Tax=Kingella potus TaxID=265175 RepID=UPI001FD16A52|nr:hypothetical protein [Kingella potus]UOP00526.1 hypothetical protein LVJ84_11895 [Kingella potus]
MAKLTQQDLRIYPSQRLTDTPDGGGLMVGEPLTGKDNELFPPVSDLDRTMGSFDARLVYPACCATMPSRSTGRIWLFPSRPRRRTCLIWRLKQKTTAKAAPIFCRALRHTACRPSKAA